MTKPNGFIIYEGPSALDGAPIVVIATGYNTASRNAKTGAMIQTYILRSDMTPKDAIASGADSSICGTCPYRGDGTGKGRICYVTIWQGPRMVYDSYLRGIYPRLSPANAGKIASGRMIRLGAYGDPAAAPIGVWQDLIAESAGHTGYSHQWRTIPAQWARLVMASADSVDDMLEARAMGYRTFRVAPRAGMAMPKREIVCPASEEAGKKTQCEACKACMGTSGKARASIVIAAHGAGAATIRKAA